MKPATRVRGVGGAVLALAVLLAGCGGSRTVAGSAPASYARAAGGMAPAVAPGWGRIKPLLDEGHRRVAAGDVAGLKALAPRISAEGLALLKANMPNDVARPDAVGFVEGRTVFGRALQHFAEAYEANRDAELPDLFVRVSEAWSAWMAAMRGLPPERAI